MASNGVTGIDLERKAPPICVVIGEQAVVAAGSVVTSGVQPFAVVAGNPAQVTGFANTPEARANPSKPDPRRISFTESVPGHSARLGALTSTFCL